MGKTKDNRKPSKLKGVHFRCKENDNEIVYCHEKNCTDEGEFLIGHPSGIGGWTVIGVKDMMDFLKKLNLLEKH